MKFGISNAHLKLSGKISLVEQGPYITEVQAKLTLFFSKMSNCRQKKYMFFIK
jgi:hypothetical protein